MLAAAVLGSGLAALDGTVVNVALPAIGEDLDADSAGLQWILNGYLLTLASLILLGGALGDRYGRRRVFVIGVVWFAAASLLCGLAPTVEMLIAARVLQGVGGALLTPGQPGDDPGQLPARGPGPGDRRLVGPRRGGHRGRPVRSAATWSSAASWRWIFLINLPIAAAGARGHAPRARDAATRRMPAGIDVRGAVAGAVGLAGVTYALIGADSGVAACCSRPSSVVASLLASSPSRRAAPTRCAAGPVRQPQFSAANVVTFVVYAALGGSFFLLVGLAPDLARATRPLEAGAALFPVTVIMLLLSARAGALAQRIGPRIPLTVGPLVAGAGAARALTRIEAGLDLLPTCCPPCVVFGLGLVITVAPLTATVLAAADERHAGIASGVNNAVARTAGCWRWPPCPAWPGSARATSTTPSP